MMSPAILRRPKFRTSIFPREERAATAGHDLKRHQLNVAITLLGGLSRIIFVVDLSKAVLAAALISPRRANLCANRVGGGRP